MKVHSLFLLILFMKIYLSEGWSNYTETCICTVDSKSGYYCAQTSCEVRYVYNKCFSGQSTVQTRNGKHISLSNVQIGEEVLVFDGTQLIFEPIYDITHNEKVHFYPFIRLTVFNYDQNL